MNDLLKELQDTISATKNARFNASRRMRRNKNLASLASPLLSAYIIALNLLKFSPEQVLLAPEQLSILTISLSVMTLVISLLIQNRRYGEREVNYHLCGEELSRLYDKVSVFSGFEEHKKDAVSSLYEEYHKILIDHNLNHNELDHLIENKKCFFYKIWWFIYAPSTFYFCLIVLPPVLFFAFFI